MLLLFYCPEAFLSKTQILYTQYTGVDNYAEGVYTPGTRYQFNELFERGTADNVHRKYSFRKEEEHEKVQ